VSNIVISDKMSMLRDDLIKWKT